MQPWRLSQRVIGPHGAHACTGVCSALLRPCKAPRKPKCVSRGCQCRWFWCLSVHRQRQQVPQARHMTQGVRLTLCQVCTHGLCKAADLADNACAQDHHESPDTLPTGHLLLTRLPLTAVHVLPRPRPHVSNRNRTQMGEHASFLDAN